MSRMLVIDVDPGIGDALAIIAALLDPDLDVIALTATEGCVSGEIATRNLHAIVEQAEVDKWPRIGVALEKSDVESPAPPPRRLLEKLNGPTGLGEHASQVAELHHRRESSKLLSDLVREHPHQVTLLTLGPLGNLLAASERTADFLNQLEGFVCLGGAFGVNGDITAAAETNILLDPEAARIVLRASAPKFLVPLDVTNKVLLTLAEVQKLSAGNLGATPLLQRLLNFSLRAHHAHLGMESLLIREVVALAAVTRPELFRTEAMHVDVELRGELTRGMTIADRRTFEAPLPNVTVATEVDAAGVVDYLLDVVLHAKTE